jgi:hypothetical protein
LIDLVKSNDHLIFANRSACRLNTFVHAISHAFGNVVVHTEPCHQLSPVCNHF